MSSQRKQGSVNHFVKQKMKVFGLEPISAKSQHNSVITKKMKRTGGKLYTMVVLSLELG